MSLTQIRSRIVDVLEDLCGENHVDGAVPRIDPPFLVDEPIGHRRARKVNTEVCGAACDDQRLVRPVATTEIEHGCPELNMLIDRFSEGFTKAGE
jgi:hypothetical protein